MCILSRLSQDSRVAINQASSLTKKQIHFRRRKWKIIRKCREYCAKTASSSLLHESSVSIGASLSVLKIVGKNETISSLERNTFYYIILTYPNRTQSNANRSTVFFDWILAQFCKIGNVRPYGPLGSSRQKLIRGEPFDLRGELEDFPPPPNGLRRKFLWFTYMASHNYGKNKIHLIREKYWLRW